MSSIASEKTGRSALLYMLSLPILIVIMWLASPTNFHWYHTFWCNTFGIVAWFLIALCGTGGFIRPWAAILLTLETGFGLVPVVYLLLDFGRVGEACYQHMHQSRILASVPVVVMAKQLGRTVIDMHSSITPSVWWHLYVDVAEILIYISFGMWTARDMGEQWFLIYTASPVIVSSLLADHVVLRVHALLRANARLMQTAFAAAVLVDGEEDCKVVESTSDFDVLVDGEARGLHLTSLFSSEQKHFKKLLSPACDGERVIRRLKTTLISISKSFQQEVELRVLSATEHELQSERGILLGVALLGERLPFNEAQISNTSSLLLEQYLDYVGQLRISGLVSSDPDQAIPEVAEVDCFDSVSLAGIRQRKATCFARSRASSTTSSSISILEPRYRLTPESSPNNSRQDATAPYRKPWKESGDDNTYLKECSLSILEDLINSWNYSSSQCCHWHASCNRLADLVDDLRSWHACNDRWPAADPSWQCDACRALQRADNPSDCWLCFASRSDEAIPSDQS